MSQPVVLAYSGGLDTSFCIVHLREELGMDVICVTADTGGFSAEESDALAKRASTLGATEHVWLDVRDEVFDDFVTYIVKGNLLKGSVYPLCVAAERTAQARAIARWAAGRGIAALAHGSTAAGNDAVRFDVAFAAVSPDATVLTPIRDLGLSRAAEAEYLAKHGHAFDPTKTEYSVNESLWGITIGGGETHDSWAVPPDSVYRLTRSVADAPAEPAEVVIGFDAGVPVALDGRTMSGPDLIVALNEIAGEHGVGRGIHCGETVLGVKGRIAFEAPAPVVLIEAHRELEKLVQTKWQAYWAAQASLFYAQHLHEGQYFDPVMRDLEALLDGVNRRVTGDVRVSLHKGSARVSGVRSPHSLLGKGARYGEETALWDGRDAAGFGRIASISSRLAAGAPGASEEGAS